MYVPTPTITNGVVESPVFAGLFGSINTIVDASTVSSSLSLLVINEIFTGESSLPMFPESLIAIGASLTPVTVISNVLVVTEIPSVTV